MELKIAHLYPEALNLYGDSGNILCLRKRAEWRGISVSVTPLGMGEWPSLKDFDLFFLGGGQDYEQSLIEGDLTEAKIRELRAAASDGKTFLGICGGYQMLGEYYLTGEGVQLDYLAIGAFHTVAGKDRITGNLLFDAGKLGTVVGYENHSGRTFLDKHDEALGQVLSGCGNNGSDSTEGYHRANLFGTYCHGPVLPKNPALADALLLSALRERYALSELEPLDDDVEQRAHEAAAAMTRS